jgi:hypothetical protein
MKFDDEKLYMFTRKTTNNMYTGEKERKYMYYLFLSLFVDD